VGAAVSDYFFLKRIMVVENRAMNSDEGDKEFMLVVKKGLDVAPSPYLLKQKSH